MTSGMTAFMVAVSGTSLICYLLMVRVQNRKDRRESAGGDTSGTKFERQFRRWWVEPAFLVRQRQLFVG